MVLHCAVRTGLFNYLYQQRHEIAFALGIVDEVPITECGHKYFDGSGFYVDVPKDSNDLSLPAAFHVQEINLILNAVSTIEIKPNSAHARVEYSADVVNGLYASPALSIFHPPC